MSNPAPVKPPSTEEIWEIENVGHNVINAGQVRITPAGTPGCRVKIPASRVSEGLKRLMSSPNSQLKRIS